ncbi:oxidoreductase [Sulfolobales archaeon HS-7]|nr:oxidoreductase [Sulfolobales archaeon HS-7]
MKIAVVGCRGFGTVHLRALSDIRKRKDIEVYVFSRDETAAKNCMKEFQAKGYFTKFDSVLESEVNIIDLVVSHDEHMRMGLEAINSGKHVMLEKPIARNLQEADALISTANEKKVKFMVLENFYFDTSVWKAKELIEKIKPLSLILVRDLRLNKVKGWRTNYEMMGNGSLIDGGIHFVDTMLNLGGEYKEVKGMCKRTFAGIEGEDTSGAIFDFGDYLGMLTYSWAARNPPPVPAFEIYGEKGTIVEDPKSREAGKPFGDLIFNGERIVVEKMNPVVREIEGFIDAVEKGKTVPMDPYIARRDLEAVLKIYEGCEQGAHENK